MRESACCSSGNWSGFRPVALMISATSEGAIRPPKTSAGPAIARSISGRVSRGVRYCARLIASGRSVNRTQFPEVGPHRQHDVNACVRLRARRQQQIDERFGLIAVLFARFRICENLFELVDDHEQVHGLTSCPFGDLKQTERAAPKLRRDHRHVLTGDRVRDRRTGQLQREHGRLQQGGCQAANRLISWSKDRDTPVAAGSERAHPETREEGRRAQDCSCRSRRTNDGEKALPLQDLEEAIGVRLATEEDVRLVRLERSKARIRCLDADRVRHGCPPLDSRCAASPGSARADPGQCRSGNRASSDCGCELRGPAAGRRTVEQGAPRPAPCTRQQLPRCLGLCLDPARRRRAVDDDHAVRPRASLRNRAATALATDRARARVQGSRPHRAVERVDDLRTKRPVGRVGCHATLSGSSAVAMGTAGTAAAAARD